MLFREMMPWRETVLVHPPYNVLLLYSVKLTLVQNTNVLVQNTNVYLQNNDV